MMFFKTVPKRTRSRLTTPALALLIFGLLGFSDMFGGPYGFFRFLFVLTLIGTGIWVWILFFLYRLFRKSNTERIHVSATVVDEEE